MTPNAKHLPPSKPDTKGFSLMEVLIALTVFSLVSLASGGMFACIQQSWRKQAAALALVNNSRWAMEFMTNEIRRAFSPAGGGDTLSFQIDPDGDGSPPFQTITYRKQGLILERQQDNEGWQELTALAAANPGGNPLFSINSAIVTIQLTVQKDAFSYTLRSAARPRN